MQSAVCQQMLYGAENDSNFSIKSNVIFNIIKGSINILSISFVNKAFVLAKIVGSVLISLWLQNIIALKIIELAIELQLGTILTILLLVVSSLLPIVILHQTSHFIQRQLDLSNVKTEVLKLFLLFTWALIHIIQLQSISTLRYHEYINQR